jgi:hypothetical protein
VCRSRSCQSRINFFTRRLNRLIEKMLWILIRLQLRIKILMRLFILWLLPYDIASQKFESVLYIVQYMYTVQSIRVVRSCVHYFKHT